MPGPAGTLTVTRANAMSNPTLGATLVNRQRSIATRNTVLRYPIRAFQTDKPSLRHARQSRYTDTQH